MHINISNKKGFTLLELLIVIGILAVLTTVVILVINPGEYLAQARDGNRLSDMDTLNKAISLYNLNSGGQNMGSANIVYVSIPDSSPTCTNLGLPTLPAGYTYQCSTTSSFTKTDGTGWVPLNLSALPGGSPIARLPGDPINATSTRLYYTYATNGNQWELTSAMESSKYQANEATDGGIDPAQYEVGTSLVLSPFAHGLVGYWNLDNNSNDSSGYTDTGTWSGTPAGTNGYYSAGKVGTYAGYFNGSDNQITTTNAIPSSNQRTLSIWLYLKSTAGYQNFLGDCNYSCTSSALWNFSGIRFQYTNTGASNDFITASEPTLNVWHYVVGVYDGNNAYIYIDGVLQSNKSFSGTLRSFTPIIGGYMNNPADYLNGLIDDVRIYNRALSAAEVAAIYNATK